ncbi:MAG: hypothetical protein WBP93_08380, partial [Pyrinomonadaceae bacterium]
LKLHLNRFSERRLFMATAKKGGSAGKKGAGKKGAGKKGAGKKGAAKKGGKLSLGKEAAGKSYGKATAAVRNQSKKVCIA